MTEGQQNRPGVNLEELERQLRMASRAHTDATSRSTPPSSYSENPAPVPDLNALRRDFTRAAPIAPPSSPNFAPPNFAASNFTDELSDPGPPPAFLSAPPHAANQPEYASLFDERFPLIDRKKKRGSSIFRALAYLIVVFLLGSLGYFFYTGKVSLSGSTVPDQKSVPVIKADPNPVKIVPEANPSTDATPSGSELFGKKGADTVGSATTKSTVEAPVDVNSAVKANANKSNALVTGMGEPKSVRTVTVRPDGTLIGEPTAGAAAANPTPVIVTPSPSVMAQEAPPAAAPATPPAASTPAKPAPAAAESPPSAPASPTGTATVNGNPVPLPPPRPIDLLAMRTVDDPLKDLIAQATNPDPPPANEIAQPGNTAPAGDYGVQFGATPSEAEANALSARLKTQLADLLGDHKIAVIKADSNGKPIYRVRALGYSRDEAAVACASAAASASGTKCFIARN